MPTQLDLDEVAEAYFAVRTPDRPEYERLLIRAREKAVLPLLRALLGQALQQRRMIDELSEELDATPAESGLAAYLFAKSTFEPTVDQAYDVIQRIGESAKLQLCQALGKNDYELVLAAALLLSWDESPGKAIHEAIQKALAYIKRGPDQALVFMVLGIAMARAGDLKWQQVIEDHAQKSGLSFEEWVKRTTNSALIELQRGG
jgi:hypothetical protein